MFLTCSADSSMALYHVRNKTPVLKFQSIGSDFALNDICWCPGNSTVFAAVAADAKIQLWDLSYSCIDPVTIIDTNADPIHTRASAAAPKDDDTPVSKLLKNLQQMQQTNRSLTTVIFSEHSPIIIVGDSRGVVTLYRVLKPIAVTNETKAEMSSKLKQAIFRQADPVTAAKLLSYDNGGGK